MLERWGEKKVVVIQADFDVVQKVVAALGVLKVGLSCCSSLPPLLRVPVAPPLRVSLKRTPAVIISCCVTWIWCVACHIGFWGKPLERFFSRPPLPDLSTCIALFALCLICSVNWNVFSGVSMAISYFGFGGYCVRCRAVQNKSSWSIPQRFNND